MNTSLLVATQQLLDALGHREIPFGTIYSDMEPAKGYGPKESLSVVEAVEQGWDMAKLFANFTCFIGSIWLARKKHMPAYIAENKFGCIGGSYYCGFSSSPAQKNIIAQYVSTGSPSMGPGERYFGTPEGMLRFLDAIVPPPAPAKYCVTKPLDLFAEGEKPLLVTFFARPEVICGLSALTTFTTDSYDSVLSNFCPGCGSMVAWPLRMLAQGRECAVLGISDPSCRKFLKTDEQIFTVPLSLYERMLDAMPESLLHQHTWQTVYKKVARSNNAWVESA
ncbi:MAG: DUF169 domain-containing protein [Desulfovibrio sp.]|jgi:uncharacterized protein (DUF169 family)|nr:DUF169 domain-containing protein [Desulfovibrio sp.]